MKHKKNESRFLGTANGIRELVGADAGAADFDKFLTFDSISTSD